MYALLLKQIAYVQAMLQREEGQDLIEYALIVVLISLAVVTALGGVGDALNAVWGAIAGDLAV